MGPTTHIAETFSKSAVRELLASPTPARLGFTALDGAPRVQPIWFHWNGRQFIMNTGPDTPKAKALGRDPRVALTIDTDSIPYRSLQVRGRASLDIVSGVAPEYELMASRYYGEHLGRRWIDGVLARRSESARITVQPEWAFFLDMASAFPAVFNPE